MQKVIAQGESGKIHIDGKEIATVGSWKLTEYSPWYKMPLVKIIIYYFKTLLVAMVCYVTPIMIGKLFVAFDWGRGFVNPWLIFTGGTFYGLYVYHEAIKKE